jgi:cytochrome P450
MGEQTVGTTSGAMTKDELIERFGRDVFNDFDVDDPSFNDHFAEILDAFAAGCPVAQSQVGDGYKVINRYADLRKAGQNWKVFSSAKGFQPNRPEGVPYLMPEESDPPYHTNWRRTLNPFLAPKTVATYEDDIRDEARKLIEAFQDDGHADLIPTYTAKVPGYAFFRNVIGIPTDDLELLIDAVEMGTYGPVEQRPEKFGVIFDYMAKYLQEREQQEPRGDIVDTILAGVDKFGEPCPFEDKLSIIVDLTFGGIATTTYVMSGAIHHLANNLEDQRTLREDPSLIPQAVEEFVRYFPPVVMLGRSVNEDIELGGHQFKKDDFVLLNFAAASRDPEAVDNPDQIDIFRETVVHTAFGVGVHRCIGSHLARLEVRVVIEEILKRLPEFRETEEPEYETGLLRAMRTLKLAWDPAAVPTV